MFSAFPIAPAEVLRTVAVDSSVVRRISSGETDADVDWILVNALISWDISKLGNATLRQVDGTMLQYSNGGAYLRWLVSTRQMLRQAGLAFYDRYPKDRRRWIWLAATLKRDAATVQIEDMVDEQTWQRRIPELTAAFLVSSEVGEKEKGDVAFALFLARARRAGINTPATSIETPETQRAWGEELLILAQRYPTASSDDVRSVTKIIFWRAKKEQVYGPGILQRLRTTPNHTIRQFVNADIVVESARQTPMSLRFIAMDGRRVDLAALRGKVVLLAFSGYTWCGACRILDPDLVSAYRNYHQQGLEIIGIAIESSPSNRAYVTQFLKQHDMPWPHYFDGKGTDNEYVRKLGVVGVPHLFLFDKNGLLVDHAEGAGAMLQLEQQLKQQL